MSETNREIVEKVNAAFSENKPEIFLDRCTDDVEWTIVGDQTLTGKSGIREFMSSMGDAPPPKFTVDEIVEGDDSVACYGEMTMPDENGNDTAYSFCDVYRFNGGKITTLRSFCVKHKTEGESGQTATA
jgi:ketosteroid isomerase-like protein